MQASAALAILLLAGTAGSTQIKFSYDLARYEPLSAGTSYPDAYGEFIVDLPDDVIFEPFRGTTISYDNRVRLFRHGSHRIPLNDTNFRWSITTPSGSVSSEYRGRIALDLFYRYRSDGFIAGSSVRFQAPFDYYHYEGSTTTSYRKSMSTAGYRVIEEVFREDPSASSFGNNSAFRYEGEFSSYENIVVVTHGWQRDTINGLPEVVTALERRLAREGIADKTLIIEHRWSNAVSPSGLSGATDYFRARGSTEQEGGILADHLQGIINFGRKQDPTYDPNIHFIGHSLGAMVNANAVGRLHAVDVEQVTVLDSPFAPGNYDTYDIRNIYDHSEFYYDKMPLGSVQYVENYVAGDRLSGFPNIRFGQLIDGAGEGDGGTIIEGTDHVSLYSEYYASLINDDDGSLWNSPVLDSWRPGQQWNPNRSRQERADRVVRVLRRAIDVTPVIGSVIRIGEGIWRLRTESPAGVITEEVVLSDDMAYLDIGIHPLTEDGVLSVTYDSVTLVEMDFGYLSEDRIVRIPIGGLADVTRSGNFRISIGEDGSEAIADITSVEIVSITRVPEPAAVLLSAILFIAVTPARTRIISEERLPRTM